MMLQQLKTLSIFSTLLLVVSVFVSGVAEANSTPTVTGAIPEVKVGNSLVTEVIAHNYFSDPDGDTLTYAASSANTNIAEINIDATFTTKAWVLANGVGQATATITVTDPGGLSASQSFTITVLPSNNSAPTAVGTIPDELVVIGRTTAVTVSVSSYFSDTDGAADTLTYSATSSDTSAVSVSISGDTVSITAGTTAGTATVTVTATDLSGATGTQTFSVTSTENRAPTSSGIGTQGAYVNNSHSMNLDDHFSDLDGDTLTYTASSDNTSVAPVSISGSTLTIGSSSTTGGATINVKGTDPDSASASASFQFFRGHYTPPSYTPIMGDEADATAGLSSAEQSLLGRLLTYDTLIINELHNGSDDANDWLELRNVSHVDIPLDTWQLKIQTGSAAAIVAFPAGTVIPAGEVLLLANTEIAPGAVVVESFMLPQTEFALILRSPTAFGDLAGNYFQTEKERPETAPALTADTAWERVEATTSGYRAEAWAASPHRNGLGSPGYQSSAVPGDLNHDDVVNILDLVLVASQFGTTGPSAADLNGDNTVNIQDLVLVANGLGNVAAAPSVGQSSATLVKNWLQLAQQSTPDAVGTSLPKGFSYEHGIQMLEQLARALTPDTTALLANYPNPFNPETWIPYQLSKATDVTVTIYAADGSVVRTLALGHQDAGMYKNRSQAAYWDGRNAVGETMASGVYFYTLTAGEFSATRKMLILK